MTLLQQDIIKEARKATSVIAKAQALKILAIVNYQEMLKKANTN